jgi:hypothetical protein
VLLHEPFLVKPLTISIQIAPRIRRILEGVLVAACALTLCCVAAHGRSTYSNNYVLLADAIEHGHLWIDWPGRIIDAAAWNGRHFVIDGPFPALFLLPLVAVWGTAANQTAVAIAGGVLATVLGWRLLLQLGLKPVPRLFLTAFLFAGTDLWWCSELGVQFIAQVFACCMTFAALGEAFGRQRGWLLGLYAVCAIESRYALLLALPLYVYLLALTARRTQHLRSFAIAIGCGLAFWVGYNEMRWARWYDIAHFLFYNQDPAAGEKTGSPLALKFIPYNIYAFLFRAPVFVQGWMQEPAWPYITCDANGIALTFTSPALVLAFLAKRSRMTWALWITVCLVAGPNLLNYTNGWWQYGMRHALDFEPFLLVLMAMACRNRIPNWGKALCVWSIGASVWGVWWWKMTYRAGN